MAASTVDSLDVSLYIISDYLAVLSMFDEAIQVAKRLKSSPEANFLLANIYAAKVKYPWSSTSN